MTPHTARRTPALRPLPRWASPLSGALLLLVLAGGAWFLFGDSGPLPFDTWWYQRVVVQPDGVWRGIAAALALIGGSAGAAACFAIAVAWLLASRRRGDALAVALGGILGVAGSELLKRLVQRPRPPEQLLPAHGFSYPSGHSMGAAALAVSVLLVVLGTRDLDVRIGRAAAIVAVVWVVAMMWSRTALNVHWLSDTLAGASLGIAAALLARALCVQPRPNRVEPRGSAPSSNSA